MSRGWVYVLDNPSMPGKVKIGFTERIPDMRASELDATGVPTPFNLQFTALVDRAFELEQAVHISMDANRVRLNREWFDLTVDEAIEAIRSSASKMGLSLLFEDDRFSDVQDKGAEEFDFAEDFIPAKDFVACVLKNNLHHAFDILKSIPSDCIPSDFFWHLEFNTNLFDDDGNLQNNENGQSAADIIANNAMLEEQIFGLLFESFYPKCHDNIGCAIVILWHLFPKRRQVIDRLLDAHAEKLSTKLASTKIAGNKTVFESRAFANLLIERNKIGKAIAILQRQSAIDGSGPLAIPLGAILSISGATHELDTIIKQSMLTPLFVDKLVKIGFPENKLAQPEYLKSAEALGQVREFLVIHASRQEWKRLNQSDDN